MEIKEGFEAGFLQVVVTLKFITPEDAIRLLLAYNESDVDQFDQFLLGEGILEQDQLLEALSEYYQVPSFDVTGYFFETHLLRMFSKDMLVRNEIIPLQVDENMMIVVAANPNNPELLFEIGENVSYDIRFYVGIALNIVDAVREYYDKADTEDPQDEDLREEHILQEDFEKIEDEDSEAPYPVYSDEEDSFE